MAAGSGGAQGGSAATGTGGGAGTATGGAAGGSGLGGAAGSTAGTSAGGGAGGGTSGSAGTGNDAGASGSGAGAGGTSGATGGGGSGSNPELHGGASAAFVCPGGPYGDPLAGMGDVTQIGPPTMGQPNYFAFIEGPVWIGSLGKLFFSDNVSPERIWQLTPGMMPSVFFASSSSNGLAIDNDDQLIVADQVMNRITRVDPTQATPSHTPVADAGAKPNDLIVRSDGNLYFTAPNGSGTGFHRITPAGMRQGPRTEVNQPNGIVLSPDENTLYVGDVGNRTITAFTLAADGAIGATATPFATTVGQTADGMCVDCAGNVYVGTAGGVEVFSPAGAPLGTVPTGEASNCTFGGADRRTLYVTSRSLLKAVTLGVPGLPD